MPVGSASSAGKLTLLVYPSATSSTFTLYEDDDTTTSIQQSLAGTTSTVTLSRVVKPALVRVRVDATGTASVALDAAPLASVADFDTLAASSNAAFFADAATRSIWVNVPPSATARTITVTTP